jgi:hypothetical protein
LPAAGSAPGTFLGPLQDEAHADALIGNDELELFYDSSTGAVGGRGNNNGTPYSVSTVPTVAGTFVTALASELNALDGLTAGTVTASKAVVVSADKDASAFRNVTVTNLDAGASGTAGSVDVFPTTASKGKLAITTTDQTGDTIVSLVVGAMAAARTITLADPLAAADILTGKMAAVARTATDDGLTTGIIADAGLLQFVTVTSANAAHIIVLPTPTPGRIVLLANGGTGYELRSSAPATVAINGGAEADAESAIAASTLVVAVCKTATAWAAFSLVGTTLAAVEAAAAA